MAVSQRYREARAAHNARCALLQSLESSEHPVPLAWQHLSKEEQQGILKWVSSVRNKPRKTPKAATSIEDAVIELMTAAVFAVHHLPE